jgi:transposase
MRTKGTAAELEVRRRIAADLLGNGKTPAEVVELLGVSLSSAKRWKKVVEREGPAGLAAKPHPGPRPKLSEHQRDELCDLLVAGALAAGFATDLWTCFRVGDLIQKRFGISYHFNHVGRLLHDLGFSQQQPRRRARERDEAAIARWREYDWPRIKKGDDAGKLPSSFSMKRASCSSR